jgi:MFS-type transporter involved in bile tolerance (Atg22 family)
MVGISSAYLPVFWAIPTETLSKSCAAAAVGMINAVGSVAGFVGPYMFGYLNTRTGTFAYGLGVVMVSTIVGALLILRTPKSARTPIR